MNRFVSTMFVLAMALLAVAICLVQTFAIRESLGDDLVMRLFFFEALSGLGIIAIGGMLLWKQYRPANVMRPRRFEAVQHLRRLFAAVWS